MEVKNLISRKRIKRCLFLLSIICCFSLNSDLKFADAQQSAENQSDFSEQLKNKDTSDDKLISITLKETDIREVLNILAFKGGVNIVAGDDVVAKISVQLKEVPWEQALDVILKTYNFTYKREGNLIRVMSLARALEEEGKTPLKTKILALNFADVVELKESLNKMLSKRGTMEVDKRTNSLIITDIPEMVDAIEESATRLDTLTPQVLIEAMMVDIKITDKNQWGTLLNVLDLKNSPNELNSVLSDGSGTGLLNFGTITDNFDLTGAIVSLVSQGMASILANPKVLTLDNQKAMIEIITEIPYQESVDSGGAITTTIKFKDAGIKLSVTPHITSGRFISMNVLPEQSFQSGFAENTTQPIIDKRSAETNLLVKDGQTIVIGGLRQTTDNIDQGKIPFFGDIPFFGLFFRSKLRTKVETELVIFVTPHIVETALLSDREMELFEKLDNTARLRFDERSEMEKFKAFMNIKKDVNKAEKIAEHESKRFRTEQEVKSDSLIETNYQLTASEPIKTQLHQRRRKIIEKDVPVQAIPVKDVPVQDVAPVFEQDFSSEVYQQNKALELEADQFRKSMDLLKSEYEGT